MDVPRIHESAYRFCLILWEQEPVCDERAVRALDGLGRAAYTQAPLRCSVQKQAVTACPPAFGGVGVKNWIKSILMRFLRRERMNGNNPAPKGAVFHGQHLFSVLPDSDGKSKRGVLY